MNNLPPVVKLTYLPFPSPCREKKSPPTVNCGGGVRDCLLLFKENNNIYTFPNIQKYFKNQKVYKPLSFNIKNRYDNS